VDSTLRVCTGGFTGRTLSLNCGSVAHGSVLAALMLKRRQTRLALETTTIAVMLSYKQQRMVPSEFRNSGA